MTSDLSCTCGNAGELVEAGWADPDRAGRRAVPYNDGLADVAIRRRRGVRRLRPVPELPADRTALEAAIASAFDGTMTMPDGSAIGAPAYTTTDEAHCIARGVIDGIGIDRVRELKFGAFPWHLLGYALSLPVDLEDARPIVHTFRRCTPNWDLLGIRTATEGTDRISELSLECTRDALDDDVAEELFVIELARPYDEHPSNPSQPDLDHLEQLLTALEQCLTDSELAALDWN